jgi:hypothetical protein
MKIKLQKYSIISNEWIEEKLKYYNELIAEQGMYANDAILSRAGMLDEVKEQLIPSEKLAEVCFNTGFNSGMELSKQEFLESEIEILCKHQ